MENRAYLLGLRHAAFTSLAKGTSVDLFLYDVTRRCDCKNGGVAFFFAF